MTPDAFKDLQGPFAGVLQNMINQYIPQGTQAIMQGYQGPTSSPIGSNEQNILQQLMNTTSMTGGQPPGIPSQPATPTAPVPGATPNNPNGVPASNPVAPPTGSLTPANPAMTPANDPAIQQLLGNTINAGSSAQSAAQFAQGLGLNQPQQSLADFASGVTGASQTGAFGGATNPFMQQYIESAQRETNRALQETLSRTLPGRFTQAGQFIQPGSSSAFDRAAAIATEGAAASMGDIATDISYRAFQDAANREAALFENELARRGQLGLQTQQLTAAAQQGALERAMQAPGVAANLQTSQAQDELTRAQTGVSGAQQSNINANTQLTNAQQNLTNAQTGATNAEAGLTNAQTGTQNAQTGLVNAQTGLTGSQIQSQEVDTLIKNLQAQALPRLIQEMGVERGMEAFNNQVNSLLSVLGISAGVTRPVIANESKSSSGGFQLK